MRFLRFFGGLPGPRPRAGGGGRRPRRTAMWLAVAMMASLGTAVAEADGEAAAAENVTGTVTDSEGERMTGGYVEVYADGQPLDDPGAFDDIDTAGTFALTLPIGDFEVVAHPGETNPALDDMGSEIVHIVDGSPITVTIQLRASNVTGRILAPDGSVGVAGAQVSVATDAETLSGPPHIATSTTDGAFGLLLDPGEHMLFVSPPQDDAGRWGGTAVSVTVPDGESLVVPDITLRAANVSGVVKDPAGNLVTGSQIDLYDTDNHQLVAGADLTDADGAFSLYAEPLGGLATNYVVKARAPAGSTSYTTGSLPITVTPDSDLTGRVVTLAKVNVAGTVYGVDGTTPQPGIFVDVTADSDDATTQIDTTAADDSGRYGFHLEPGTYRIRAHPAPDDPTGAIVSSTTVSVPEATDGSGVTGADIRLHGPDLMGTVLAADGATAVADSRVTVTDTTDGEILTILRTDGAGRFFGVVPPGDYTLTAYPPEGDTALLSLGRATAHVTDESTTTTADVVLRAPTVTGRVWSPDGLSTQPDASITVYDLDAHETFDLHEVAYDGTVTTTGTGRYGFALPDGHYRITATPADSASSEFLPNTITVTVAGDPQTGRDIVLASRATASYLLEPVSVDPEGTPVGAGDDVAFSAEAVAVSANGHLVAFQSAVDAITGAAADPAHNDVYLRDVDAGTTSLVSATDADSDERGDGASDEAAVSADAAVVAFRSDATDLVAGDTNARSDVFVSDRTRAPPVTTRISAGFTDVDATSARQPTISGDATLVAFVLQAGSVSYSRGSIELCNRGAGLGPVECGAVTGTDEVVAQPVLSRDGSTLAYYRFDPATGWHLAVYDVATAATTDAGTFDPRGADPDGADGPAVASASLGGPLQPPSITDDGSLVAVTAYDGMNRGTPSIYHLADGSTTTPALFDYGPPAGGTATHAVISGDGTSLAFAANAPEAEASQERAWVLDRGTGETRGVVLGPQNDGRFQPSVPVAMSADGRTVAITTTADGAVPADTDGRADVYLAHLHTDRVPPTWGEATLRGTETGASVTTLEWTAAEDPSGILTYRVLQDGELIATVAGTTLSHFVTGLAPDRFYDFEVRAVDTFGNVTDPGLTATIRTAGDVAAGTALLEATAGPDASVDLAWDIATGTFTSYRIYRATGDGEPAAIADVPADTTTYRDGGLAARTDYRYRVVVVDGDGREHDHTVEAGVTTGDLRPSAIGATVPKLANGQARLGGDIDVVMEGSHGRTATVTATVMSWLDDSGALLDATVTRDVTVELAEDPDRPGTYLGAVPIADGWVRVLSLTGHITDVAGQSSDAVAIGFPVAVSGGLHVTIADPDGAFTGGRLTAFDYAAGVGLDRTLASDDLDVRVAEPAGDYALRLLTGADDYESADGETDVRDGLFAQVPLTARFPATVTVDLATADPALAGSDVFATDDDGGSGAFGRFRRGTETVTMAGLVSGQHVRVGLRPASTAPYRTPAEVVLTLAPGDNPVTLAPTPFEPAAVSGTVLRPDGTTGAAGASVTVTQQLDGRTFTSSARTDETGGYRLDVYAGGADVTVGYDAETQSHHVDDVTAGPVDFRMTQKHTYTVHLDLYTQLRGAEEEGPISIDDRSAYHYRLEARSTAGTSGYSRFGVGGDSAVAVVGRPGDRVSVCANPEPSFGLPRGCTDEVVLGDPADVVDVELHLGWQGEITGRIVDGGGQPFAGAWRAVASRQGADGATAPIVVTGNTAALSLPTVVDGTYDVTVTSRADPSVVGATTVTTDNARGDAGTITLRGGRWFGAGSTVSLPTNDLAAGALADVRLLLANGATDADDVTLVLPVPAAGDVAVEGVTVDGRPAAGVDVTDGLLAVPVGPIPSGSVASVHVPVRTDADAAPATLLPLSPSVRFDADGGERTEFLTPGELRVAGVTLRVPAATSERSVAASGQAPAGSTVEIVQLGAVLTSTVATPGGRWRATVDLPDQGPYADYHLQARALVDGESLTSGMVEVALRPAEPEVTQVSVYQIDPDRPDGRRFSFDPRDGAVRFPFVLVPSQPLIVEATFSHPELVGQVFAHVGDRVEEATAQDGGGWQAQFDAGRGLGDIWFDYSSRSPEFDMSLRVPEDPLRANLAPDLSDVVGSDFHQADDGTVTGDITLPSHDGAKFPVTVQRTTGTRTMTQEDFDLIEASGVPILDLQARELDDGTFRISYAVPTVALAGADEVSPAPALRRGAARASGLPALALRPQAAVPTGWLSKLGKLVDTETPVEDQIVDVGVAYTVDGVSTAKTWTGIGANSLSAFSVPNPLEEDGNFNNYVGISNLYDKLTQLQVDCPDSGIFVQFKSRIDSLLKRSAILDNTARAMDVIGVVLAPATLGLGTILLDGTGVALGMWSNLSLSHQAAVIEDEMDAIAVSDQCRQAKETRELLAWARDYMRRNRTGGVGSGVAIWDPSGVVYEAVRSNRVPGVTATLLEGDGRTGPWHTWEADWFGQVNPLATNAAGHYGWDVPEGWWKVAFTKDGYAAVDSRVVEVLPPHFDVDAGMVSLAAPTVQQITADPAGILVEFDHYMDPRTVTARQVTVTGAGGPVAGTVTAVDPQPDPAGRDLARGFRFTPATPLTGGTTLTVAVDSVAQNYAGRLLAADVHRDVTVAAAPAPGGGGTGGDPGSGGQPGAGDGDGGGTGDGTGDGSGDGDGLPTASSGGIAVAVGVPGSGTATVLARGPGDVPAGYRALPGSFVVEAPPADPGAPLTLLFRVDEALVPPGLPVAVFRDGVLATRCADPGRAQPDPCVEMTAHNAAGDLLVRVLATHASTWTLALPRAGSTAAACPAPTHTPFRDVRHALRSVACTVGYDVMRPVTRHRFVPHRRLTRGQAEAALVRLARVAGADLGRHALRHHHRHFHPHHPVTRAQFATFLRDMLERVRLETLPVPPGRFRDVGRRHGADAAAVAGIGVMPGRTLRRFAPAAPVRRGQAATYLARSLALLRAGGHVPTVDGR